jgi:hypothetical protein
VAPAAMRVTSRASGTTSPWSTRCRGIVQRPLRRAAAVCTSKNCGWGCFRRGPTRPDAARYGPPPPRPAAAPARRRPGPPPPRARRVCTYKDRG